MNNIEIASDAPVTRRDANNNVITFPRVASGKLLQLMACWASEDRAKLAKDYADAGISGPELLRELRNHDADSTFAHWGFTQCMQNIHRAAEVVCASLGTDQIPTLAAQDELCWVAAELWSAPTYRRIRYPTADEREEDAASRRDADAPKSDGQSRHTTGSPTRLSSPASMAG